MRYEEAIKFCEGYLPECDLKKIVIEALKRQAFLDQCDSMRKAVSDAQDTMP